MLGVLRCCDTHGSLFSWEPNMIIDFRAFQSCRTLSRASWAKRGGSRSWSGISESEREERRMFSYTTCLEGTMVWKAPAYKTVMLGIHCTILARFWPEFWAARLILESDRISASSGVVCRAVFFPILRVQCEHSGRGWRSGRTFWAQKSWDLALHRKQSTRTVGVGVTQQHF